MKKRLCLVSLLFGSVLLLGFGYLLLLRLTPFTGFPCIFHEWSGLLCPGCGLTRAFLSLSRGELLLALSYNPLLPLYLLYVGWFVGSVTLGYLKKKENFFLPGPLWIHLSMAGAVALFWILRNL